MTTMIIEEDDGFSGYRPTTVDPGVYLLFGTIGFCVLLNSLLPCFVACGRKRAKRKLERVSQSPWVINNRTREAENPWAVRNNHDLEKTADSDEGFLVQARRGGGPMSIHSMSDMSHTVRIVGRASHLASKQSNPMASHAESARGGGSVLSLDNTSVLNQSIITGTHGRRSRAQRRFRRALEKRVMLYESGAKAQSFFRFEEHSPPNVNPITNSIRQRGEPDDQQSCLSKMDTDEVSVQSLTMDGEREDFVPKQFLFEDDVDITCCGVDAWWKPRWIMAYCDRLIALSEWDFEMRKINKLALPFIAQAFFEGLLEIASVAVVGRLLGTKAVSAYVIVDTLIDLTFEFVGGFLSAITCLCSQAYGANQNKLVGQYFQMAVFLYLILSAPFIYFWWTMTKDVVQWFGFDEETAQIGHDFAKIYMFSAWTEGVGEAIDGLLDIVGLENFSTVIGITEGLIDFGLVFQVAFFARPQLYHIAMIHIGVEVFFLLLAIWIIHKKGWFKKFYGGIFGSLSLRNYKAVWLMTKTASTLSFGFLLMDGEWEILTLLASFLGPAEVAAWSIIGTIWGAIEDMTEAIGDAAEVRCGFLLGCGKPAHAKVSAYKSLLVGSVVSVLTTSVILTLGEDLASWITNDAVLQVLIRDLIPFLGIGNITMTVGTICWTLLGSQGRYRLATTVALFGSWLLTLPFAAVASVILNLDLRGQTAATVVGYMLSGTVNAYFLFCSDWEGLSEQVIESHEIEEDQKKETDDENFSCSRSVSEGLISSTSSDDAGENEVA